MKIEIITLHENPINAEIYGTDDPVQLAELVERIRVSGYIKPLIINRKYLILSGHRRFKAAKMLGMKEIEVEMIDKDENQELEILLAENAFREKTTVQKVREAEFYRIVEEKKAKERMLLGNAPENFREGETDEIVGCKIGMSSRSYSDSRKVIQRIDTEDDPEVQEFLSNTVNSSIHAASKLVDKPKEFIHSVMERTNGDTKHVSAAVRELEILEPSTDQHPPKGQYGVIYLDLTESSVPDLGKMQFGSLTSPDSALLIWVYPKKLALALSLIQRWGFKYQNCLLWKIDTLNEVSADGALLLISTKGKCPVLGEIKQQKSGQVKPSEVRILIEKTYSGDVLEILPDGWQIWASH